MSIGQRQGEATPRWSNEEGEEVPLLESRPACRLILLVQGICLSGGKGEEALASRTRADVIADGGVRDALRTRVE